MARFYSRRGNYGVNPFKKWGSSSTRRARGNFKASKKTADAMNLVIKVNHCFSAFYNAANQEGTAFINIYDIMQKSPQFASFIKLYDQVKVNGVRCKLNVVDAETTIGDANRVKNINIITGWDRTGLSKEQVDFYQSVGDPPVTSKILMSEWDRISAAYFTPIIGKGVANATGVDKSILSQFQKWSRSPYLYASTMEEKGCYISTSLFTDIYQSYKSNTNTYVLGGNYDNVPIINLFNSSNPAMPFESPAYKWKPTLMVGVFRSSFNPSTNEIVQFDSCNPVLFNGEFTIDITFRNLKATM